MINIQNNISSIFFPTFKGIERWKIGFLLFLLSTTMTFSQNEKPSAKENDSIVEIKTQVKNHVRKGNELYNQGKFIDAEREYKEAVALNPNYDKANFNFGNTQFLQNKVKEAKEQYELVSKLTKNNFIKADSKHNLGNIAMKDKKYAEAVNAYKESLRNNPNDDETRYNLALAQKLLKEQQKKDDKKDDKSKDNKDKKDKDKDKKEDKKDKDKDKKKDDKGEKDKDKKDDKGDDKDKDDKKDKGKDKGDKDKKEQQQPKPQKSKLSPEQVKQLLEAMNKEENKTQKKMNAKKARGRKVKQEKDW